MTSRVGTAVVLLLLLAVFPLTAALPDQVAAIRLAGVSLLWWYGGAVAPLLAGLVAVIARRDGSPRRPE